MRVSGGKVTQEQILTWLAGYLTEIGAPHDGPFNLDAEFSELGLDSVQVVIMAAEFEDRFGIPTDPAFFLSAVNLRNLFGQLDEIGAIVPA